MTNKRFIYACIAIVCGSVTAIMLKYSADSYVQIVGIITAIFTIGQTFTDNKKLKGNS